MRKRLIPLALAAVLGSAAAAAAQTDFEWTGQLAAGQSIEIVGVNGSIKASPARTGNIVVTAVKRPGRRGNASEVRFETVAHAGGVTVCAIYPSPDGRANECRAGGARNNVKDNDTEVDFTVQVPAGIGFVGQTVNGSVEGNGLQGDATATTVNGSVTLSTSGTVRATTVNGAIEATMGRAVWPNGGKFTTVNGAVTLNMPASVNADVRASTVNGGIRSDFPLQISNEPGPQRAEGTLGTGGQRLDITTVNGGISLVRR